MRMIPKIALLLALVAGVFYGCQNASEPPEKPGGEMSGPLFAVSATTDGLSDIDIPLAEGTGIVLS